MQNARLVAAVQHHGLQGMIPYFKLWELKIQAATYSNLFLVIAAVTLAGAILALSFANKPDAVQGAPRHLDIGM